MLGPDWALQDPDDYLETFRGDVRRLVTGSGVDPAQIIGIGIDFTACTMLPTTSDGTPLCFLDIFRREPHAWVKLWKHHAAQPEADDINGWRASSINRGSTRYGGKISSEWFFPKALQILHEAPDVYRAADRLVEAADWVVWQLTGHETRNNCTAGYKALWSAEDGFPDPRFFAALEPGFGMVVDDKMSRTVVPIGDRAGGLTEKPPTGPACCLGPRSPSPTSTRMSPFRPPTSPNRARWSRSWAPASATWSSPHMAEIAGMCGVAENGVVPGYFGFEAGQSAVGDLFGWFVDEAVPPRYHHEPRTRGVSVHQVLADKAAARLPGESGLLALDWWNGNRSVLVDADLSGVLVGMTLSTTAPEIYRALIESTAFGTRVIIDALEEGGVAVDRVVACGGLPDRNPLLMQIYADVTDLWRVAASSQTPALGSAMFAAVAAGTEVGGHATIEDAARAMAHLRAETYEPNASNRHVYDALYAEYVRLHDRFGRGEDPALKTLKRFRLEALDAAVVADAASR